VSDHCTTCGMANVGDEFHPHALCLLVKARGGDTRAARKDLASVLATARKGDMWTQKRIDRFCMNVKREGPQ
jgi:hypothetical protein